MKIIKGMITLTAWVKGLLGIFIVLIYPYSSLLSQQYHASDLLQGYTIKGDTTIFLFEEGLYQVTPSKVQLTGSFRNWDQLMDTQEWALKKEGSTWILKIENKSFEKIAPRSEFKFRIDQGNWMTPPLAAENENAGNLVFLKDHKLPGIKAELRGEQLIWASIEGERPLNPEAYRLTMANGESIPIAQVLPNTATETLIIPAVPLDKKRVYFLSIPSLNLSAFCSFDGWFRTLYSDKELGANVYGNRTVFRLFAPRAKLVRMYLYAQKEDTSAVEEYNMIQDELGVWETIIPKDLHGIYYDFTIHGAQDPGNHFYETQAVHITDPYARVSDNSWGKARVWKKTEPASPLKNGIPAMEDVIAYEVHVQDFTAQLPLPKALRGTFKGMTIAGLKNAKGHPIGFDYLLDLGINTVHLMPVQEYLHYPDEDWKASFENDPYMISQGVNEENYQWGYRTSHFMALESKYRTKGEEPGEEREAFRDLVQAFHDNGIAVIVDIVPNHTAENMDGNSFFFNFNVIDKLYYYRTKDFEHIGAYGNEVKTEERPMVQKWLIDQCTQLINEFGIDGFRIDLAGQIDQQSLIKLEDAIGPDKILYGEAWIGSNDPAYEKNPDWDWYKEDAPITFFQDDSRNAFKGPVFELKNKQRDRGWPGGNDEERESVMKGLNNTFPEEKSPLSGINYLDIHDNFALADQFGTKGFDGRKGVDQKLYKIAVTLLYTSLGPIVTHGGSEIMRSKGAAPLQEVVKTTKAGLKIYMHGKRDTYNHRFANEFVWDNVGQRSGKGNENDYLNMYQFWKGMNRFRSSKAGAVFRKNTAVPDDYYQFILTEDEGRLGYIVDRKVFVLLNPRNSSYWFSNIDLPEGNWTLIANTNAVDHIRGVKDTKANKRLKGGGKISVNMEAESLRIWLKEE